METIKKNAAVTGGSSGMGRAIAERLAKEGCNLAIIALDKERLESVKNELLKEYKVKVDVYSCDVSSGEQVKETFGQIKQTFKKIDYLVNCAGISTHKSIENVTEQDFDREIDVNLKGQFLCIMETYPLMKDGGSIVNIASIRGETGTPTTSPGYAAAKAGVINLTKTFALQLAKYNIRVNCISPGAVWPTAMSQWWDEAKREKIAEEAPLKRIGTPEEIANAAYFLLSPQSSYVTGHTLDVNGGTFMN